MLSSNSKVPMPNYFSNIIAGDGIREDLDGTELPSLAYAKAEAIEDARALMSDAILLDQDISSRRVEICNEAGDVLRDSAWLTALQAVREDRHLRSPCLRTRLRVAADEPAQTSIS
jgi:hypothetical protein